MKEDNLLTTFQLYDAVFLLGEGFSLHSFGAFSRTHFVDQVDLKLTDPPASAAHMLRLKACATMT